MSLLIALNLKNQIKSDNKFCPKCEKIKPVSDFYRRGGSRGSEPSSMCKCCKIAYNRDHGYNSTYYKRHVEESCARVKEWRNKNKDRCRERSGRWIEKNRNLANARTRLYRKNNPDKAAAWDRKKRACRKKAIGSFSSQEWNDLKTRLGSKCLRCMKQEPEIKLTVDHIVPLARGGTNFISNIQPLCGTCNSSKGPKIINYRSTLDAIPKG